MIRRHSKLIAAVVLAATVGVTLAACTSDSKPGAQQQGQAQTEQAFKQQSTVVPYPADQMRDSLERRNVRERLLRYNSPSKISYIYLLADTGGIYAFFTIKGKVTSNSSQMTTDQLIQTNCHSGGCNETAVNAPGDDGSYGPNEPGIFFFTTDNVMVTWNGNYLLTDAPLKVNAQNMVLSYRDGSKPTSVGGR